MKLKLLLIVIVVFCFLLTNGYSQDADFNTNSSAIDYKVPSFNETESALTTATWTSLTASPHAVSRSFCAYIMRNDTAFVYQFGGGATTQLQNVARYNLRTSAWTNNVTTIPFAMSSGSAIADGDSVIYVLGGNSTTGLGKTLKYNIVTNTWTTLADMPVPSTDMLCVKYQDSLIYVICGGDGLFGTVINNAVRLFRMRSATWTSLPAFPASVSMMGGGIFKDTIIAVAGWTGAGGTNVCRKGVINPSNPTSITWTTIASYPTGGVTRMASYACSILGQGAGIACTGGAIDGATVTTASNFWNFCTGTWQTLPPNALARSNYKGTGAGDSIMYTVGGFTTVGVGNFERLTFSQIDGTCAGGPPPPAVCTYTWTPQTSGTTSSLHGISAVNSNVAWVCGAGNTVRRTVNGGTTWISANSGITGGDVYDIAAIDSSIALATTSNATGTIIYRTSNGGANWVSVYTQTGGFVNDIEMVSATEGYAQGDPVSSLWTILRTTNGGVNWAAIPGAPASAANEFGRLDNMSVVGTNIHFASDASKVYNSTNLGTSWTSVTVASFPVTTANPLCAHFMDANTGFIGSQSLQKTTDGGVTWAPVTVPGTGDFYNIDGIGNEVWVLRVSNVYMSTNLGTSWTSVFTGTGTQQDIDLAISGSCPIGWTTSSTGSIAKMNSSMVGITPFNNEIPEAFVLSQNYPNPFNPTTTINFTIPSSGFVTLKVYNVLGKEVASLINEIKTSGMYEIKFDGSNLSSGTYFYRLESEKFVETKKMLLLK